MAISVSATRDLRSKAFAMAVRGHYHGRLTPGLVYEPGFFVPKRHDNCDCMPSVRVKENEYFDAALRRFKRACEKAGVLTELRRQGIECYLSVEEQMACGIGVCLGCAMSARSRPFRYACSDGPVFLASELVIPPAPAHVPGGAP